jgi:uracil-DNA glycosylase
MGSNSIIAGLPTRCAACRHKTSRSALTACRPFLQNEIAGLPKLEIIVALGGLSHGAILAGLGLRRSGWKFAHGAQHNLSAEMGRPMILADSYHCSRYNTNTGRLTTPMFEDVFAAIRARLGNSG